jgi:hypothetical protein
LFIATVCGAPGHASARRQQPAPPAQEKPLALRVFLDCERGCDFSYLRQEVDYLDYVRDRRDAQVHVLVTRERTGAGWEFELEYLGLERFEGFDQVLPYTTSDTDTDDEERRGLARIFQLGLVPYLLQTASADGLEISYSAPAEGFEPSATPNSDPWNFWVYRARTDVSASGEDRRDTLSLSGSLTASRTTDEWRVGIGLSQWFRESNFTFEDGETLKEVTRDSGIGGSVVKTLGDHWGMGFGASTRRSTFLNLDQSHRVATAVQYNLFPYSQSSRNELTFTYFVGYSLLNYEEVTVFGEASETRPDQGLLVSFDVDRPWGDSGFDLDVSNYLDDLNLYSVRLAGNIDYRILRGLSVRFSGDLSLVNNQIYLPASEATDEEILLGQRALDTNSRFSLSFGLSYTFGSIFNNVVNSRLTGSSGGFHRIF